MALKLTPMGIAPTFSCFANGMNANSELLFLIEAPIWSIIYHISYFLLTYFSKLSKDNHEEASIVPA
jgi:hypothetical protein